MAALVDRDNEHLRLLQMGYYIMGAVTACMGLFGLLYAAMGRLMTSMPMQSAQNGVDPAFISWIFTVFGFGFTVIGLIAAALIFLVARCLGARRHRMFCIVVACLSCLQIPWGTAIGVCTIMVLGRPSVQALFDGQPAAPQA